MRRRGPMAPSLLVCFFPRAASSWARSFRGSCSRSSSPPGPKARINRSPPSKEDAISSSRSGQLIPDWNFRSPAPEVAGRTPAAAGGGPEGQGAGLRRGAVWGGGGTPPRRGSGPVSAAERALGRDMAGCVARRALAVGSRWWSRSLATARGSRPLCAVGGAGTLPPVATATTRRHLSSR